MLRTLASWIFLVDSLAIALGAFGHGFEARTVHTAIDSFPIDRDMHSMIYVVWYFVSGCMLTFGIILLWVWWKLRGGDHRFLFASNMIGALYVGIGVFGLFYRSGDPFMAFFVALGALLLISGYLAAPRVAAG